MFYAKTKMAITKFGGMGIRLEEWTEKGSEIGKKGTMMLIKTNCQLDMTVTA